MNSYLNFAYPREDGESKPKSKIYCNIIIGYFID